MILRGLTKADIPQAAKVYEAAFDEPWGEAALLDLLKMKGGFGYAIDASDASEHTLVAFILCQSLFENAEILTIAVHPDQQSKGLGKQLVLTAESFAASKGAEQMLLEVAADNPVAQALYTKIGYNEISRRKGYYKRAGGIRVDALNMLKNLTST